MIVDSNVTEEEEQLVVNTGGWCTVKAEKMVCEETDILKNIFLYMFTCVKKRKWNEWENYSVVFNVTKMLLI